MFVEQVNSMTVAYRSTRSGLRGVTTMDGGIVLEGCPVTLKLGRSAYIVVSVWG